MSVFTSIKTVIRNITCPIRTWRVKYYMTTNKAAEYGKDGAGYYYDYVDSRTSTEAEDMIRDKYKIKRGLVVADRVKGG
jgi:hypothetical protein